MLHILAVRDICADIYQAPFFHPNINAALRAFTDEVNRADPKNALWQHSDDFELYQIGEFNEQTCEITMLPRPRQVAVASDLKVRKP